MYFNKNYTQRHIKKDATIKRSHKQSQVEHKSFCEEFCKNLSWGKLEIIRWYDLINSEF